MSTDLDAMYYGRTDRNHDALENQRRFDETETEEPTIPGDPELWAKLA